jgi:glucose/arabinose dehydrogenase
MPTERHGTQGSDSLTGTIGADVIHGFHPAAVSAAVTGLDLTLIQQKAGEVRPLGLAAAPTDGSHLLVPCLDGVINVIDLSANGQLLATPFLDLRGQLATGGDLGLSGFAFHPDFAANHKFYVYVAVNGTDGTPDNQIWEYTTSAGNPLVADPASKRVIASFDQPGNNHRVGHLVFGPDGFLYVGRGDGWYPYDGLHVAQDPNSLLGKILRLDVDGADAFPADPLRNYAIPAGNRFADGVGGAPEIWAIGVRNPWKFTFDRHTGDFYMGDVGQDTYEEVNYVAARKNFVNFGWGYRGYEANEPVPVTPPDTNIPRAGLTFPIDFYHHDDPNGMHSVTSGHVYRGGAEGLHGHHFYADFNQGFVRTLQDLDSDGTWTRQDWTGAITYDAASIARGVSLGSPVSFGEDAGGDLYVLEIDGNLWRVEARSTAPVDAGDTINADAGRDFVYAGGGNDSVLGGAGIDVLAGMDGNDTVNGQASADSVTGGDGADSLAGENGNDTLLGGAGPDTLLGGVGIDALTGGPGVDRFVFTVAGESGGASPTPANLDRITDFTASDRLDWKANATEFTNLRGRNFDGAADLNAALDEAAFSGFNTNTAVEAFLFKYKGVTYAAVEDVASNPGLDFDQGADLVVRLDAFPAATVLTEANFI